LHQAGQKIIGSQHYFSHTPETVQMRQELLQIQEAGADIGKLAVMPQNAMDVLRLLEATVQTKEDYPDYPLVTMAMGGLGTVSRISGQIFGSCMTFASLGKISAPGQLPLQNMTEILEKISESIQR
jgi:3-dehydroquinate dehydratase